MQATLTQKFNRPKLTKPRSNFATTDEVNAVLNQFKIELDQLKQQVADFATIVANLKQPVVVQQSPRQQLRWSAIKAAKDSLKAGASVEATKAFLGDNARFRLLFDGVEKQQAIEGIIKIALVQAGRPAAV